MTDAPTTTAPAKGWWDRNWLWFLPLGCLSMLVLIAAIGALIAFAVFGVMKSTDAYKTAIAAAKANSAVTAALGSPVVEGYFTSGDFEVNGASGSADLAIPIYGPKSSGTIFVVGTKTAGEWKYSRLVVQIDKTKERIDLVAPAE